MAQQPVNVPAPTPPPNPAMYSNPVSIIGPQYCLPYPVDLAVVRKFMTLADGSFTVTDINDNIMFKVKEKHFSLHDKRTLLDPAGNPVVTITEKLISAHEKHYVFRGNSTDSKDLLFTVGKSKMIQLKTTLNVYLASNNKQDVCDFKIKGSWLERSCIFYAGESKAIVAQMQKRITAGSVMLDKDRYTVTVYPNIDYAFVVALIVILDEINNDDDD
ncbi:protein LURP-one-related 10 isoform X2 [Citrus sinensis]|uniref:protein LURP-one-related 10 isoform X2 n=1 Tax=Citrus sinensis TaxID=2711 RepID=UPI00227810E4|nr:protein LURP-one-related 10 isoform X2 [Citrus sinensis]